MDAQDNAAANRPTSAGAAPDATPAPEDESPPAPSPEFARLLRWEDSGGGWRVAAIGPGTLTLSLVTCDGGEEMEVLTATDPAVLHHVGTRRRHP